MVSYRRRRYLRRRRYGRRYRRYRRSYARRYVNASSRSSIRMKCNETYTNTLQAGFSDDATSATVLRIRPYDGSNACLTKNTLYKAYLNLYEETKLIGMKINLSVTSPVGDSVTPSLQIYTAWDRRSGSGEQPFTAAAIKAAASSSVATALNNNVAKLSRSIYASDLIEKAQWHDSSVGAGDIDTAWQLQSTNPNFFSPAFFLFFNSPTLGAVHNISYTVSVTYYVAFRNPKYGGTGSGSKELPVKGADLVATDDLRTQVPANMLFLYDFMVSELHATPERALARCLERAVEMPSAAMVDYDEDVPAAAAEPAELGKRQRSNASAAALVPDAQRPKNA